MLLYVKDKKSGVLVTRKVAVPSAADRNDRISWIVRELISGPTGNRYERIFSPDLDVQKIIVEKGTAYISFGWQLVDALQKEPAIAIASIVNSVLANVNALEEVKILIEGIEPVSTFSGISLQNGFTKPL